MDELHFMLLQGINTRHIIFSHRPLPCMNSTILIGSEFNLTCRYCGVCGYGIKISLMFVKYVSLLKCISATKLSAAGL